MTHVDLTSISTTPCAATLASRRALPLNILGGAGGSVQTLRTKYRSRLLGVSWSSAMLTPTVCALAAALSEAGLTTLRLAFRCGVGRGNSSANDVRGACAHLKAATDASAIVLVGYSYGSCVVADVAGGLVVAMWPRDDEGIVCGVRAS